MKANDVLIDLLEDNRRRIHRLFDVISDECLYWQPNKDVNSIAVTVWHMARIFDVFLTRQVMGLPPTEECWFHHHWVDQTKYDPGGIGLNGWGMLTGYSLQEVADIPRFKKEHIIGYLDDVYDSIVKYLETTSMEELITPAIGFEGKYSRYQCIQMALLDNVRHLGEVLAIHARKDPNQKEALWG
jgi:hypothetical protein